VRVAAGAIAKKWLKQRYGVTVRAYMSQLGALTIPFVSWDAMQHPDNDFFSANVAMLPELANYLDEVRAARDSVGAQITVVAEGVPVGWGEPVFDRLDAEIAYAMMSINAVKGVEIGAGFAAVAQRGSEHSDEMTPQGFVTNHAGGILGGISTGQSIQVNVALKPTSSIPQPRRSVDKDGLAVLMETKGRHDPCVGVRATPIVEAMLALVLIDHALRHRGQNADVQSDAPHIV
jgi:chorismate synthase